MPKIRPTSATTRKQYRDKLHPENRPTFNQLAALIDAQRDDLRWHHKVGTLFRQLRAEYHRGADFSRRLAKALGTSREWLEKSARFAALYKVKEIPDLERKGINWTRLYFCFVIKDKEKRHDLLQEAVRERWSDKQLRLTVQQRFPSGRSGIGGRPRRPVTRQKPEVALHELGRLCKSMTDYDQGAWSMIPEAEWNKLLLSWPAADRTKLQNLLTDTDGAVRAVAEMCKKVRGVLASLLQQAKRPTD